MSSLSGTDGLSRNFSGSYLSNGHMADEYPAWKKPVPSSLAEIYLYKTSFDPQLCVTPEKRAPTLVKLNSANDEEEEEEEEEGEENARETRVHFDQSVAVHYLSPEISTDVSSSIGNSSSEESPCYGGAPLLSSYVNHLTSDTTSIDMSPPVMCIDPYSGYNDVDASFDDSSYRFSPRDVSSTGPFCVTAGDLTHVNRRCDATRRNRRHESDLESSSTNSFDSWGPISVVASDLRHQSSDKTSLKKSSNSFNKKTGSLPRVTVDRALPDDVRSVVVTNERPGCPCESNSGYLSETSVGAASGATGSVLARPGFNSTLRWSKEMEELKNKEFDKNAVIKGNLDPKIKVKIDEKALTKLNADKTLYTDLTSLEVHEDEILSRVAEAEGAKVRVETGGKVKPEVINYRKHLEIWT